MATVITTFILNHAVHAEPGRLIPGRKDAKMEIKAGQHYKGNVNNEVFRIVNATAKAVTYEVVRSSKTFTVGREMFEHCVLTRV